MNWLFKDSDQSTASHNDGLSFIVDQQPNSSFAETNSNLSVVSYKSKSRKEALPAKVRWWKVRNGQSSELLGVRGSMYPCEPSDLGFKIKAEINSVDQQTKGTAVVWFGPIKIETGIRQNLHNIINSGHTMFPVFICSGKDAEREGVVKISETSVTVIDNKSNRQLKFPYNLTEPRLQLNAKDIFRICLRFREENHEAELKSFMNESFGLNGSNSQLSDSSQLFKPSNKLQLKLLSRHTRDLITFSLKAFATKRQMMASAIIQKIQRLDLSEQQQFKSFFEFEGLKQEVIRMNSECKKTIEDRDRKIQDLKNSEDEIVRLTRTYTKIINQKYKDNSELNESISILNNRHNQIEANVRVNELQKEIKQLKNTIRDQFEEIQLLRFLKRDNANSQPDPTPFSKKKSEQFLFPPDSAAIQLSKENSKLLEEINRLKKQQREESRLELHRSKSQIEIQNILQTLGEGKHNETSVINPSFVNQSMNESAEIRLLEEKFFEIKQLNEKLLKDNQYHIKDIEKRDKQIVALRKELLSKQPDSVIIQPNSNSEVEEQLEKLKQENKLLSSKYQDILKEGDLKSKAFFETEYYRIKSQHSICEEKIKLLEQQLAEVEREREILHPALFSPELEKYKVINNNLLLEVNTLKSSLEKISVQKRGDSMHTLQKRIFQLESELDNLNSTSREPINKQLSSKLFVAQQKIKELEEQVSLKETKINTMDGVIERLMNEIHQKNMSMSLDQSHITSKSIQKYKMRINQLKEENEMLKRSTNALNRSRDLSMQMYDYNQEKIDDMMQKMDLILLENQRISNICDRYAKDAKDYNKLKHQNLDLKSQLEKIKSG